MWIAQDTTESRVPRLNVHTNQILAHTFSHLLFSLAIPTNITFWIVSCSFTFLVVALATTVSALVDEVTVR